MTQTLSDLSLITVYTAIGFYLLAFIAFTLDLARRASWRAEGPYRAGASLRLGVVLSAVGLASHVTGIVLRGIAAERVPWDNLYGYALISTSVVVAVFLGLQFRENLRFVGAFVMFFVGLLLGGATTLYYVPVAPLVPALQSPWLVFHVFVAALGLGFFGVGAAISIVQLMKQRQEKDDGLADGTGAGVADAAPGDDAPIGGIAPTGATDGAAATAGATAVVVETATDAPDGRPGAAPAKRGRIARFLATFPAAEQLEALSYRVNIVGFVFWTFTLIAGAIWANFAWGRFWGWDTKEVWTFIVWVVYAGYIHARATRGWRGSAAAWLSIIGFAAVIFNSTIVNVFFKGLHAYSGIS